jgi:D-alanyl-D-alanine dipeptidase
MLLTSLLVTVLGLQAAPAAKPAPIAAAPAAEAGPSVEVPAELARLTGPDTIAVIFVDNVQRADEAIARIRAAAGSLAEEMPVQSELRRLLKDSVRTELEIPLNQPVLWWIDQPAADGDEPPMGMSAIVSHQAFRIPGATAAAEKHRAESAQAKDAKSRPAAPVRARTRGSSVSVLPNDLVVVSSDREPFAAPGAEARPSALLQRLPASLVCGRMDIGRLLDEQGDQLKMMAGFLQMSLMSEPLAEDATPDERRREAMQSSMAQAAVDQVNHLIDALMQLRRASFAVTLEGDDLRIWADWSREAAFPAGLDAVAVERLAAALPRGLQAYWGISSNALDTMFTERLSIDDAVVNLGATDDERKAWADAMARARAVVAQVDGGMVGGVALLDLEEGRQAQVVSMRVRDAAAFRRSLKELAPAFERSGAGRMSIREEGEALTMRVEPNAARLKEAIEVLTRESMDDEAMESFDKAMQPSMVTMRFRGNEVLMAQDPSGNAIDAAKLGDDKATDIRKELVTGSWGTLDWFIAMDLRDIIAKAGDAADDEELAGALKGLRGGKPLMFRISQGVQGNTARLSAQANLTEIREVAQTVEKAIKAAEAKSPAQDGDHDEDEDEQEGAGMTSPASAP